MIVENLDYSKTDPSEVCFKTQKDFEIYAKKLAIIVKAQKNGQLKNNGFIRLLNETFTPEEILFAASCHYMETVVKL